MKSSIQKKIVFVRTWELGSNGLGFGEFWSRTDDFKFSKDFFSLNGQYFQEESAIIFVFIDFQVINLDQLNQILMLPNFPEVLKC
jgi:hypothetical protein